MKRAADSQMFDDPLLCVCVFWAESWFFGVVDNNWKRLIQVLGLEQWSERFRHTRLDVERARDSGENIISHEFLLCVLLVQ